MLTCFGVPISLYFSLNLAMFKRIVSDQSHALRYLLPAKRDSHLTDRLRSAKLYPPFRTRTTHFQNPLTPFLFINFQ